MRQTIVARSPYSAWTLNVLVAVFVGIASIKFPLVAGGIGLLGVMVAVFYYRPYWGYTLIAVAATLTHFRFASPIGHWRLEQVASVLGTLAYLRLRSNGRFMRFGPVGWLFLAWVGINGLSSLFAPEWFQSEKIVAWLLTDFFAFLLTREVANRYGVYKAFLPFWLAGIAAVVVGIGMWLGNPLAHQGRAMGLMQEPDVFGTFSAIMTIYGLAMLGDTQLPHIFQRTRYLGLLIGVAGTLLSGTRSSLIGLVIALLIAAIVERRWARKLLPFILMGLAIVGWFLRGALTSRLSRLGNASTLAYRMVRVKLALHGIFRTWHHFILGHGTNAYGQFHLTVSPSGIVPDYLGVQIVTVPYDTGLIGTLIFGAFLVLVLRTMWVNRVLGPIGQGSFYALLAMLVAYQATNGIWFGFTWLTVALGCGYQYSKARGTTGGLVESNC